VLTSIVFVLLTQVLQVTGLGRQLSAGLVRWRAHRSVGDPGNIIVGLVVAPAGGTAWLMWRCCGPEPHPGLLRRP
jgi:hypothetical protein